MRGDRTPRPPDLTAVGFRRAAIHHLRRFPSSEANLKRVMTRRVKRAIGRGHTDAPAESFAPMIDALVRDLREQGLLDDNGYAKGLANSLHRRGKSLRAIRGTLREKGVPAELIDEAIERIRGEHEQPELLAATRYAKRRRLGPFRVEGRADRRERDLASLGRQGFAYGVAKQVIDADTPEGLPQV